MKRFIVALCLVGCNTEVKFAKSAAECKQEIEATSACYLSIAERAKTDQVALFTEICESRAKTFPCQLEEWEIDGYVDMKCPAPSGCEQFTK